MVQKHDSRYFAAKFKTYCEKDNRRIQSLASLILLEIFLLNDLPINTEGFVTSIETGPSVRELETLIESVHEVINSLRSKDTEHAETFKQQIASLEFTQTLTKQRMVMLANQPELVITKQASVNLQFCC
ncbi:hypothetical protein DdX_09924 [Ditylenchus destructor]|uniref:Uncharacterized protein n=1 Tax=Ditylenchus destructor TaxID=166010 RepID=A0AAD4R5Q7_9BILA|nr:hypothetical protein DdX_09924 [Ditylenchus destructor]